MSDLIVCTIDAVRRFSDHEVRDCAWLYLGKDLGTRERVALLLGEKGLVSLGDRLHYAAERLRQPFLDFIADLGRIQTDRLGWWSSSCAWKDAGASDLFLLICYEEVVGNLVRECRGRGRPLVVVVEDIWLFRQLTETHGHVPKVEFRGRAAVWSEQIRALAAGLASRVIWLLRLLRNYASQARHWTWEKSRVSSRPVAALYSDPQVRCLREPDGWIDPYLGQLDRLLVDAGYSVLRFSLPESGGFEEPIGRRRHYFRPLVLYMGLSVLRACFISWRLTWPSRAEVSGRPIECLLRREFWKDRWRSSHFLRRVFFECVRKLLEVEQPTVVVFPYENQPWEKLLVLAAQRQGISTLGYQHGAGMSRFRLSYFHGRREADFAPIPDCIVASGPYSHEMLLAGGTPKHRLIMGGSLRFQHLLRSGDKGSDPSPAVRTPTRVLVALPIEPPMAQHLLSALRRAFPDGGRSEGVEFVVKPHSVHPVTERSLLWPATIVNGSFEEAMRACSVLIYTGTSTGIEALAMGRRVIRYRSELLLDLDVSAFIGGEAIVDCGDHDLRTKLLMTVQRIFEGARHRLELDKALGRVFKPVDEDAWLEIVHRFAGKCSAREAGAAPASQKQARSGSCNGMLKTIIFDLDGVLIESTEIKTRAFRALFADYPDCLERIIAYHEANGGVSRFDKFRHIFADILKEPLSAERFNGLCERYTDICLNEVLAAPLVTGAEDFLRDFHERLWLFVASGTPEGELTTIVERRGLARYFRGAFGSPATKTEIVRRILADWSLEPTDALLVGDSETDLLAAAETGVAFIGRMHVGSPASWKARPGLVTINDIAGLRTRVKRDGSGNQLVEPVAP